MISSTAFIHPKAIVDDGVGIGDRTRIWAFAHLVAGSSVGNECNICDHTFIEGRVQVGNRVTIKCGVYLWDGVVVEDDVFIGPAAVFTNDPRPRSRHRPLEYPRTTLQEGCSIGANATILPGLTIGKWAMVGAGSVVTANVSPYAVVLGNPARFHHWVCRCGAKLCIAQRLGCCSCGRSYELDEESHSLEQTRSRQ